MNFTNENDLDLSFGLDADCLKSSCQKEREKCQKTEDNPYIILESSGPNVIVEYIPQYNDRGSSDPSLPNNNVRDGSPSSPVTRLLEDSNFFNTSRYLLEFRERSKTVDDAEESKLMALYMDDENGQEELSGTENPSERDSPLEGNSSPAYTSHLQEDFTLPSDLAEGSFIYEIAPITDNSDYNLQDILEENNDLILCNTNQNDNVVSQGFRGEIVSGEETDKYGSPVDENHIGEILEIPPENNRVTEYASCDSLKASELGDGLLEYKDSPDDIYREISSLYPESQVGIGLFHQNDNKDNMLMTDEADTHRNLSSGDDLESIDLLKSLGIYSETDCGSDAEDTSILSDISNECYLTGQFVQNKESEESSDINSIEQKKDDLIVIDDEYIESMVISPESNPVEEYPAFEDTICGLEALSSVEYNLQPGEKMQRNDNKKEKKKANSKSSTKSRRRRRTRSKKYIDVQGCSSGEFSNDIDCFRPKEISEHLVTVDIHNSDIQHISHTLFVDMDESHLLLTHKELIPQEFIIEESNNNEQTSMDRVEYMNLISNDNVPHIVSNNNEEMEGKNPHLVVAGLVMVEVDNNKEQYCVDDAFKLTSVEVSEPLHITCDIKDEVTLNSHDDNYENLLIYSEHSLDDTILEEPSQSNEDVTNSVAAEVDIYDFTPYDKPVSNDLHFKLLGDSLNVTINNNNGDVITNSVNENCEPLENTILSSEIGLDFIKLGPCENTINTDDLVNSFSENNLVVECGNFCIDKPSMISSDENMVDDEEIPLESNILEDNKIAEDSGSVIANDIFPVNDTCIENKTQLNTENPIQSRCHTGNCDLCENFIDKKFLIAPFLLASHYKKQLSKNAFVINVSSENPSSDAKGLVDLALFNYSVGTVYKHLLRDNKSLSAKHSSKDVSLSRDTFLDTGNFCIDKPSKISCEEKIVDDDEIPLESNILEDNKIAEDSGSVIANDIFPVNESCIENKTQFNTENATQSRCDTENCELCEKFIVKKFLIAPFILASHYKKKLSKNAFVINVSSENSSIYAKGLVDLALFNHSVGTVYKHLLRDNNNLSAKHSSKDLSLSRDTYLDTGNFCIDKPSKISCEEKIVDDEEIPLESNILEDNKIAEDNGSVIANDIFPVNDTCIENKTQFNAENAIQSRCYTENCELCEKFIDKKFLIAPFLLASHYKKKLSKNAFTINVSSENSSIYAKELVDLALFNYSVGTVYKHLLRDNNNLSAKHSSKDLSLSRDTFLDTGNFCIDKPSKISCEEKIVDDEEIPLESNILEDNKIAEDSDSVIANDIFPVNESCIENKTQFNTENAIQSSCHTENCELCEQFIDKKFLIAPFLLASHYKKKLSKNAFVINVSSENLSIYAKGLVEGTVYKHLLRDNNNLSVKPSSMEPINRGRKRVHVPSVTSADPKGSTLLHNSSPMRNKRQCQRLNKNQVSGEETQKTLDTNLNQTSLKKLIKGCSIKLEDILDSKISGCQTKLSTSQNTELNEKIVRVSFTYSLHNHECQEGSSPSTPSNNNKCLKSNHIPSDQLSLHHRKSNEGWLKRRKSPDDEEQRVQSKKAKLKSSPLTIFSYLHKRDNEGKLQKRKRPDDEEQRGQKSKKADTKNCKMIEKVQRFCDKNPLPASCKPSLLHGGVYPIYEVVKNIIPSELESSTINKKCLKSVGFEDTGNLSQSMSICRALHSSTSRPSKVNDDDMEDKN